MAYYIQTSLPESTVAMRIFAPRSALRHFLRDIRPRAFTSLLFPWHSLLVSWIKMSANCPGNNDFRGKSAAQRRFYTRIAVLYFEHSMFVEWLVKWLYCLRIYEIPIYKQRLFIFCYPSNWINSFQNNSTVAIFWALVFSHLIHKWNLALTKGIRIFKYGKLLSTSCRKGTLGKPRAQTNFI